jgi:hypothetical protein
VKGASRYMRRWGIQQGVYNQQGQEQDSLFSGALGTVAVWERSRGFHRCGESEE